MEGKNKFVTLKRTITYNNYWKPKLFSFEDNCRVELEEFYSRSGNIHCCCTREQGWKFKAYIFLNLAGREANKNEKSFVFAPPVRNAANTIHITAEYCESTAILKWKFAEICDLYRNVIMERHKFNTRMQKEGKPFQSFVADLRILASTCKYGALKDELIHDKTVCCITSLFVWKQLLKERDVTLDHAIEIGIVNKLSDRDNTELSNKDTSSNDIHNIGKGQKTPLKNGMIHNCENCGGSDAVMQKHWPAFGKQCLHCKKQNHFETICHAKRKGKHSSAQRGGQQSNQINEVYPEVPDPEDDDN